MSRQTPVIVAILLHRASKMKQKVASVLIIAAYTPPRISAAKLRLGDLTGVPRAIAFGDPGAHGGEDFFGHRGGLAGSGRIDQSVKASEKEDLDPPTDGLFVRLEMHGDLGNAPSRIREAQHLQSIPGVGGNVGLVGASVQFAKRLVIKMDAIHGVKDLHALLRVSTNRLRPTT